MRVRAEISVIFLAFLSASYCSSCLSSSHQVYIISRKKSEQKRGRMALPLRKQLLSYLYIAKFVSYVLAYDIGKNVCKPDA